MVQSIVTKKMLQRIIRRFYPKQVTKTLPRGRDVMHDLQEIVSLDRLKVIFDVGANVGQSSEVYLNICPNSQIYCFEPVDRTFRQLEMRFAHVGRIKCYNVALGATSESGVMIIEENSSRCRLVGAQTENVTREQENAETTRITTIDEFCKAAKIDHIDYLKIDTEGGDLEVLKGADEMLSARRIDVIEVEAGMNPFNTFHVPMELLKPWLESRNYLLFGVYEQIREWPTGEQHLRRANLVFISDKCKWNR